MVSPLSLSHDLNAHLAWKNIKRPPQNISDPLSTCILTMPVFLPFDTYELIFHYLFLSCLSWQERYMYACQYILLTRQWMVWFAFVC
jgi:hypothetical protein